VTALPPPPLYFRLHTSKEKTLRLQLIPHSLCIRTRLVLALQVGHRDNLHCQAGPACKMLGALSLARLGIVLFPREACFLPTFINGMDEVFAERRI